jgi:hypothetical protein
MTNDKTKLDLSVPAPERPPARASRSGRGLLWVLLPAVAANIVVVWWRTAGGPAPVSGGGLDGAARKELALKLERQGIGSEAAAAWREYLAAERLTGEDAARIWYRIGTLYQEARQFDRALGAYYRSESHAPLEGLELEISRRAQRCLEAMGKFASLRQALDERVGIGSATNAAGGAVLAEIGPRKITRAELDRLIERHVGSQIDQLAPHMPEAQRLARREALLKDASSAEGRRVFLQGYLLEELLYRYARETGLAEDPAVREWIESRERALLAGQAMQREVAAQARITPTEMQTWYEAHKDEYVEKAEGEEGEEAAPRPKPYEEVREEIYRTLRARKEQELRRALFERLMAKYDVVVHRPAEPAGE